MFARRFVALALVAGLSVAARADDKLKTQAAEAMKKADVDNARVVETQHLVVATALPEAKAKALADGLEKVYAQVAKGLKLSPEETKVQVTLYVFTEVDQFRQFQRSVLKERPDDDEYATADMKRDDAFVAVSARRGEKDPKFENVAGGELSKALLAKKAGSAKLPGWMTDGFAKAVTWRLNPASASAERATVARMAPALRKGAKGAATVADKAWSGTAKEKEVVAASLMDYFTSGPGAEKFGGVLSSLIPTDATAMPSFLDALKAADLTIEDLDRQWREWVSKGSPAAK
jgi:hypothetical protein